MTRWDANSFDPSSSQHFLRGEPNGTLWIANDLTAKLDSNNNVVSSKYNQYQRTYVHEFGNKLSREISANGSARTFGNPKGIAGQLSTDSDNDTGARLEKCVFGNVIP